MDELKNLKLYYANYFIDLKAEAVFECNKNDKQKDYLNIINRIELFEQNCYKSTSKEAKFINKTIHFCTYNEVKSILIITNDEYISKNDLITIQKKSKSIELLTNEKLKAIYLFQTKLPEIHHSDESIIEFDLNFSHLKRICLEKYKIESIDLNTFSGLEQNLK